MPLPVPALVPTVDSLALGAAAVVVPLVFAVLVYADARRRSPRRSGGRSLAPLAWGATTFFSGVGCLVVAACYVAVRVR
ncbi:MULTISPECIES: hypothetical protein [Halorussus]|uniref:hypothetical protein n=1 Tax=Halorussus TaxID=1070314 RepID=UPI000E20F140|nr:MULTISPECIES: hypothetical protein [Halorussus]NHN60377.1 hypothetical protein [Halorussus sp. JP-T4]